MDREMRLVTHDYTVALDRLSDAVSGGRIDPFLAARAEYEAATKAYDDALVAHGFPAPYMQLSEQSADE